MDAAASKKISYIAQPVRLWCQLKELLLFDTSAAYNRICVPKISIS